MFKINCVLLYWRHFPARLLYNDFKCHSLLSSFSVNIHFKALGMNKIGTPRPFLVLTRCHVGSWQGKFGSKKPSKNYELVNDSIQTLHTANIFNVIFSLFKCVPLSTVIPLYYLHLITAPSTVEKCKH